MVTGQLGAAASGIARRTVANAIWAILAFGAARFLSFGTNLVLARLLAPADFGLVSFALIFITASTLLQDLGMSAAIIYGGRDARTVAGTALTINVAAALGLFALILLATPFVAGFQSDPAAAGVLVALAAAPVITAIGSVQSALLMRELDYRRKVVPDTVPYVMSGVVSVGLAMAGYGVWSLVIGNLVRTGASTSLLWLLSDVRPLPALKWPIAVDLLSYGKHIAFQSILGFLSNNLDYLVIGYLLGAHALGLYTMAYMVANVVPTFSQVAISVMFPALSRLRDDRAALDAMFTDAHRILWALTLPAAILLFIGAPAFVFVVLGDRWVESSLPLRILAGAACLQSVVQVYGPASKAAGRPDLLWKFVLVRCVVSIPLLFLSVRFGIEGVAACVVLIMLAVTPPASVIFCRAIAYPPERLLGIIAPFAVGGAAMCGLVLAVYALPDGRAASETLPGAIVLGLAALLLYALVVRRLDPALPRLMLQPLVGWRQKLTRGAAA